MTTYAHTWAKISDDAQYRYVLGRRWDMAPGPTVCWVMLNPSTADAAVDDATIRRCVGFSVGFGFHALTVVNLFAYRTHNPKRLLEQADPVGPENVWAVEQQVLRADQTILAWGTSWPTAYRGYVSRVSAMADYYGAVCLGKTKAGQPRHPLYLPATAERIPF